MTTKRRKPDSETPPSVGTTISHCTFTQTGVKHNEHTAAAVTALAEASEAHAVALEQIARLLGGQGVTFGPAINMENPS